MCCVRCHVSSLFFLESVILLLPFLNISVSDFYLLALKTLKILFSLPMSFGVLWLWIYCETATI